MEKKERKKEKRKEKKKKKKKRKKKKKKKKKKSREGIFQFSTELTENPSVSIIHKCNSKTRTRTTQEQNPKQICNII